MGTFTWRSWSTGWAIAVVAPALMMGVVSCQAGPEKVGNGDAKLAQVNSAEYLDRISAQPTVSEADALRGILLILGQEREISFAEAVELLRKQKVVPAGWRFQAGRAITKGRTAYMIYQACRVRGGLTLTLIGPTQRYCLKELQYRGLMSPGVPYNTVSGMEYVAVLTRADELRQTGKVSEVMKVEGEAGEQQ